VAGDLADESALLVEIHSLEVGLVCGEDLVGLWNDPNLKEEQRSVGGDPQVSKVRTSELSSSMTVCGRY
jgi:hypothetical protein